MDAIFYRDDTKVKKMKKFMIFSKIFGIEGEIARKSIYSRKKVFVQQQEHLFVHH